jgi:DNA ligase-1
LKWYQVFSQIEEASGSRAKLAIVEENKDDLLLENILHFAFDGSITTGISKKKIKSEPNVNVDMLSAPSNVISMINYLLVNSTGKKLDVALMQKYLNTIMNPVEKKYTIGLITKDLPLGISAKSLNKVYGNEFIYHHPLMLGKQYDPKKLKLPADATIKLDGFRGTVLNYQDGIKILSKTGKPYTGLIDIEAAYQDLPKGYAYDGEILAFNPEGLDHNLLYKKTSKIMLSKGIKQGVRHIVFDALPIEEFLNGKSKKQRSTRRKWLEENMPTVDQTEFIELIDILDYIETAEDLEKLPALLKKVSDDGEEGLMLCYQKSKYTDSRSFDLQKYKEIYTVDLRVTDIVEHKRGGKCGSLVVNYKGNPLGASVGRKEDQENFWQDPDSIIGKIIEIEHYGETHDKNGNLSLRFPEFKRLRLDKDEESYD